VTATTDSPQQEREDGRRALLHEVRARHPRFIEAVVADARVTAGYRGERAQFRSPLDTLWSVLRLIVVSDAFLAQIAYRAKARMQALGIPFLPYLAHRIAIVSGQVSIGDPVLVHPGVYLPHGQVVVDGLIEIHPGAVLFPWTTLGLIGPSVVGPTIGPGAQVGTGAKVLGQVEVGANARVGANAVVLVDVPAGTTVVGMPARAADD
jgi:serine O-acetyltransferase